MAENVQALKNISSSPHARSNNSTQKIMLDVIIGLIPVTAVGLWHFGLGAVITTVVSILSCVASEFVYNLIAHKPQTIKDGSAVVTGLLLALVLPPNPPVYVPFLGGAFAIFVVKCFFGGLGKNFMNPALGARCFLLISFGSSMINYSTDTITGATPLGQIQQGLTASAKEAFFGTGTGIIGLCSAAVLVGGIYLLVKKVITWHIPVSMIGAFLVLELLLGQLHSLNDVGVQLFAGGVMLGAFFMATDMVTSPMTSSGMLLYGAFIGIMCSLFRVYGSSADSVSYAIIFANCIVPLIDLLPVPKPMGYGIEGNQKTVAEKKGFSIPSSAIALCVITLLAGIALGGVNFVTRDRIAEQQLLAEAAAYKAVLPAAETFAQNEDAAAVIEALEGGVYGTDFGNSYVKEVWTGSDASGNVAGYAIKVTNNEAFDGSLSVAVGISVDGTVTGISFTEINETAGMGMNADTDSWKGQFTDKNVERFNLDKSGACANDNDIACVSGATITSNATINAVNAALGFFADNLK